MASARPPVVAKLPATRGAFAISRSRLMVRTDGDWEPYRNLDILDVADSISARFDGLYLTDLDGRRKGEPQLDYLQEISRDADVWADTGVQRADDAIDALVAGARRAVLPTSMLASGRELRRAWKLSQELVVEIAVDANGRVVALEETWAGASPIDVARTVRAVGPDTIILAPRAPSIDWALVAQVAQEGPTWVGGPYLPTDAPALRTSGAAGAVLWIAPAEFMPAELEVAPANGEA